MNEVSLRGNSAKQSQYIIMLGPPGAGKGTQAAILSREMNLPHIASGDLFRQALEGKTELGLLAKYYMEKGELVPDEITIKMVLERVSLRDCSFGCLLDGFPRTLEQAKALEKAFADKGKHIDRAIYIKVRDEELLKRLGGRWLCRNCQAPYHMITAPPRIPGTCDNCGGELYQRPDDKEETVKERLNVFFAQTMPILDYYKKEDKLIEVNGNLGIQDVAKEIVTVLRAEK